MLHRRLKRIHGRNTVQQDAELQCYLVVIFVVIFSGYDGSRTEG
jgi:hypothetical protein